jgi:hypothetical protein
MSSCFSMVIHAYTQHKTTITSERNVAWIMKNSKKQKNDENVNHSSHHQFLHLSVIHDLQRLLSPRLSTLDKHQGFVVVIPSFVGVIFFLYPGPLLLPQNPII